MENFAQQSNEYLLYYQNFIQLTAEGKLVNVIRASLFSCTGHVVPAAHSQSAEAAGRTQLHLGETLAEKTCVPGEGGAHCG